MVRTCKTVMSKCTEQTSNCETVRRYVSPMSNVGRLKPHKPEFTNKVNFPCA
jgi:hypothetical protein